MSSSQGPQQNDKQLMEVEAVLAPGGPCARSGHRMVCSESNVYVIGGYYPNINPVVGGINIAGRVPTVCREIWKFNMAAKTWAKLQTIGNFPLDMTAHSAVLHGNHIVVYGGTGAYFGQSLCNLAHALNLKTMTWTALETKGEKPMPLYGQGVVLDGDTLYTVGGTDGTEFHIDIHKLDLSTLTWERVFVAERVATEPFGRYRHTVFHHDGKLFVVGGGQAVGYQQVYPPPAEMKTLTAFDLKKRIWEEVETFPSGDSNVDDENNAVGAYPSCRMAHSGVQHEECVYIAGGANQANAFSDLWKLHLPTMRWTLLKPALYGRPLSFHDMAVTPAGCAYSFGGLRTDGPEPYRVDDFTKIWLTVPNLKEQSWDSLVEKTSLTKKSRWTVLKLKLGLPTDYLDRLRIEDSESEGTDDTDDEFDRFVWRHVGDANA